MGNFVARQLIILLAALLFVLATPLVLRASPALRRQLLGVDDSELHAASAAGSRWRLPLEPS